MNIKLGNIGLVLALIVSWNVHAQTFAPNSKNARQPVVNTATAKNSANQAETKGQKAKDEPIFDENGAPNIVVKNFDNLDRNQKKTETQRNERAVYSFKIIDGEPVFDDMARSILISYGNYQVHKSFDNWVRCSLRIYVVNDLTEKITNFSFKLHWPEMSTVVQMNRVNPGVSTYKDIVLLGDGCFHIDKIPTIEVNRCRVKGMTQEQCADAVKWFKGK